MTDETFPRPDESDPELLRTTPFDDGTTGYGFDTNADGREDTWVITDDATGATVVTAFDDDLDGTVDTVVTETEVITVDDQGNVVDSQPIVDEGGLEEEPGAEYVDPDQPYDDGMIGDPYEKADYWFEQSYNGWCGPASISQFVAEYYQIPDLYAVESAVVQTAMENGWLSYTPGEGFDGWSGMTTPHMVLLLEEMGIPAEVRTGDLSSLAAHLEAGHEIIVAVDSSEVISADDGFGNEVFTDDDHLDGGTGSDHALTVAGIDTERGLVLLNNPGIENGELSAVPIEQFEDAWADSGHTMIVASNPLEGVQEVAPYQAQTQDLNPFQEPSQSPVQSPVQTEPEFLASPFEGAVAAGHESPVSLDLSGAGTDPSRTMVLLPLVLAAPIAAGVGGVVAGIAARRARD